MSDPKNENLRKAYHKVHVPFLIYIASTRLGWNEPGSRFDLFRSRGET